jgi:dTDP-4-amino-4,6-dideoxygalactose transaminase
MYSSNWPKYDEKTVNNITKIVKSGKINQWNNSLIFDTEKKISKYFNVKHALLLSNGTVALELALRILNISSSDIIVSPRSFIASVSCVNICGSHPIFSDVNINTGNIDLEHIKQVVTPKTKCVIIVHLGGMPAHDIEEIVKYCHEKNIFIINDLAQAINSKVNDKYLCNYGDLSILSFCTDKQIPAGEGGCILTNNNEYFLKLFSYREHGKNFYKYFDNLENKNRVNSSGNRYNYVYDSIGSNFRMHILEASIVNDSLDMLDDWTEQRRRNAKILIDAIKKYVTISEVKGDIYHSYYRLYCYVKEPEKRDKIVKLINDAGIPCFQGACPEIYKEKAYNLDLELPNAKLLGETSLCFLVDPCYDEKKMNKIATIISIILRDIYSY